MAHTIMKEIYSSEKKKYLKCEILVLDEEEILPNTDRREIILSCDEPGTPYTEISGSSTADVDDLYPETELIDQYSDFDGRE